MNALIVGADPTPILERIPNNNFLLIDDGAIIDAVTASKRTFRHFDVEKHALNVFKDMSDSRIDAIANVIKASQPEGENTLTKATADFQIRKALKDKPKKLRTLIPDSKETQYAYQMIERLFLSDTLRSVLNGPPYFSMKGTILAHLDRAELGDFAAWVIGNFLISLYPGTVVVPDFGFYACAHHVALIRQSRLVAGIHSFDQVPKLRDELVLIDDKQGSHSTPADAELLASYQCDFAPGTTGYATFIKDLIGARA